MMLLKCDIKKISNKGMPNIRTGLNGDLIIHFSVLFPKNIRSKLHEKNIDLLKKILVCDDQDTKELNRDKIVVDLISKNDNNVYELEDVNNSNYENVHSDNESQGNEGPECVQQ